jgi:hypothetical protein
MIMRTTFGLEREKIRATLDKKPLAMAMALMIETLQGAITTDANDFWVNTDLNVNIRSGKALDNHVRVNAYVPSGVVNSENHDTGKIAVPPLENRIGIRAELDEKSLAWAMAWVIQTLLTTVQAEQGDFWVNIDLNVRIKHGKAQEKRARINVYGDLVDAYDTTIVDTRESNVIPEEILQTLCEELKKNEADKK